MKIMLKELPEIRDNTDIAGEEDIEIFEWAVENGEFINAGAKMVEVMVGKVSVDIAAPIDGKLTILVEEGEIVNGETCVAEIV